MLLSDLRLKFARDLIGHWVDIRGGALVPLDEDIDPRQLLRSFDYIAIADFSRPAQVNLELAGSGLARRYGRDLRNVNWMDLVPPELSAMATRARERIRGVPCGAYYKFTASREGEAAMTAETLALPLRQRIAALPHAVIAITRDVGGGGGGPPLGWLAPPAKLEHFSGELVDIGAGVPAPIEERW
jgi:hypothetical protein